MACELNRRDLMSKSYKWTKVVKKSIVFAMALSINLSTGIVSSSNVAKAATPNKEMIFSTTAYTAGTGSITASGRTVKRNPNGISTISVDPRVIPFGTYLYIEGYGYAVAADTGSAITGNELDLYFDSSSECYNWGRKTANVIVLGDSSNS
jgi:3D (Asp-Asp-Asp) domain-containing protein